MVLLSMEGINKMHIKVSITLMDGTLIDQQTVSVPTSGWAGRGRSAAQQEVRSEFVRIADDNMGFFQAEAQKAE